MMLTPKVFEKSANMVSIGASLYAKTIVVPAGARAGPVNPPDLVPNNSTSGFAVAAPGAGTAGEPGGGTAKVLDLVEDSMTDVPLGGSMISSLELGSSTPPP